MSHQQNVTVDEVSYPRNGFRPNVVHPCNVMLHYVIHNVINKLQPVVRNFK